MIHRPGLFVELEYLNRFFKKLLCFVYVRIVQNTMYLLMNTDARLTKLFVHSLNECVVQTLSVRVGLHCGP